MTEPKKIHQRRDGHVSQRAKEAWRKEQDAKAEARERRRVRRVRHWEKRTVAAEADLAACRHYAEDALRGGLKPEDALRLILRATTKKKGARA